MHIYEGDDIFSFLAVLSLPGTHCCVEIQFTFTGPTGVFTNWVRVLQPEPETIKVLPDCNRTINNCNSTVTVIDGLVTVWKNFYSFGFWMKTGLSLCYFLVYCYTLYPNLKTLPPSLKTPAEDDEIGKRTLWSLIKLTRLPKLHLG